MTTLDDIFQVTLGLSACGVAALLAYKLLRIMTRYNIILIGQALEVVEDNASTAPPDSSAALMFRYRLRIQSLEASRTEYPLQVTIKGFPIGSCTPSPDWHVWTAAGWKSINVIHPLDTTGAQSKESGEATEPYFWRAIFPELPALDAWTFDVLMPCERLEFCLGFVGFEESKFLTPTFGPYFEPDRLAVSSTDHGEATVRGSVTMPRPVVPIILSVLTITFYILVRTLSHLRIDLSILNATDGWLLFAQLLLIWLGYAAIRRRVYPVISGYRFITPTWPVQNPSPTPSEKPEKTAS